MFQSAISKILAATAMLSAIVLTGADAPKQQMPPIPTVSVEPVAEIIGGSTKNYIGQVEADEEVDLQVRVSGVITKINVKDGDWVKEGELIATIEDTTYRAKADEAKAMLDQISAELDLAKSNSVRYNQLFESKATSIVNVEEAARTLKLNQGKYDAAKASLLDAQNDLSYCKIYAPISGRIGRISETYGNYVSLTSKPLATIVKFDPILIKFSISERDYQEKFGSLSNFFKYAKFTVMLANGKPYNGKLEAKIIDNKIDKETGTLGLWIAADNPDTALIPGGFVTVSLGRNDDPKLPVVPLAAILTDRDGSYVYVLGEGNMPVRRPVKLGEVIKNVRVVESGLAPGEIIVVDGIHKIMPGLPVKTGKE